MSDSSHARARAFDAGAGSHDFAAMVADRLAGPEDVRVLARLRDVRCAALLRVDVGEHARRQSSGLGAIGDRDVLEALMAPAVPRTPHPVPAAVRRPALPVAVPPVTVGLVVVTDSQWSRGLERATRFGPYCSRVLAIPALPGDPSELLLEATYYGVGVATADDPQMLPAAPFLPLRFTSSSWAFAEAAYSQYLTHTHQHLIQTPADLAQHEPMGKDKSA